MAKDRFFITSMDADSQQDGTVDVYKSLAERVGVDDMKDHVEREVASGVDALRVERGW